MKLTIKQLGADIQASPSALRASGSSLEDVQNQFSDWLILGLTQMDWPELDEPNLPLDAIKLPDIDLDLAEIDWQFVMLDPFAAFKQYVYPQLSDSITKQLKNAVQQYGKENSLQQAAIHRQGVTRYNSILLNLLTILSKQKPQSGVTKATLGLELKRQLKEALETSFNPLEKLQLQPNGVQLRHRLVQLCYQDKTLLPLLVAPLYEVHEQQRVTQLLTCLSAAQYERFISLLEFTTLTTGHVELQQHRTLLLTLHELFIAHNGFSERLLEQTTTVLKTSKHAQMLSMWCALNKNQCNQKALSDLHRIVSTVAQKADLAIDLVGHTEFAQSADMQLKPATKITVIGAQQQQILKQVLLLLQILANSHMLPKQQLKAWLALQTIRVNQTQLSVNLASKLDQVTQAFGDALRHKQAPHSTLEKIVKLAAKLRTQSHIVSSVNGNKRSLLKLYSLLSRLPDVPVLLLELPLKWQAAQAVSERTLQSWLDDASQWSLQYQRVVTNKQSSEFAVKVNNSELVAALKRTKSWLAQPQQTQVLAADEQRILVSVIEQLKSLPIQTGSSLWLQLQSGIVSRPVLNRVIDTLLKQCEYACLDKSFTPTIALTIDEAQFEKAVSERLDKFYEQFTRDLDDMMQCFEQEQALSPKQITASNCSSLIWQCCNRVAHMAAFGRELQLCYLPSVQRIYGFVLKQQVWLVNELNSLLGAAEQGAQGRQLQQLITQHVQSLNLIKKELVQKLPLIERIDTGLDAWLMPLVNHATKQISEVDSIWLKPVKAAKVASLNMTNQGYKHTTVAQPLNQLQPMADEIHNVTQTPEEGEASLSNRNNSADTQAVSGHAEQDLTVIRHDYGVPVPRSVSKTNDQLHRATLSDALTSEHGRDDVLASINCDAKEIPQSRHDSTHNTLTKSGKNLVHPHDFSVLTNTFNSHNQDEESNELRQAQGTHGEIDTDTSKGYEIAQHVQSSIDHAALEQAPLNKQTHFSSSSEQRNSVTSITQPSVTQSHRAKQPVKSPLKIFFNALVTVEHIDDAQQLLAHLTQQIHVHSTPQSFELKQAIEQSQSQLAKLARTTRLKANKEIVQNAIAQAQSQLAQLQAISEQQNNPESFDVGLVILWPFLPTLFTKLDLVYDSGNENEGQFKNDDAYLQAHAVLCYIANVDPLIEESLTVNALLGLPLDTQVDQRIELDEPTMMAIDYMLQALVSRWQILKGMPVDEFVRMFITREGTVEQTESGCHINVVSMPQDVLMSKLPWGLGMVQLPWLDQALLHIEWKYGF
ncbi:hypothetical protein PSECIP111951_00942 [Pseudoalteromonas holothuriae]|uniref:Uncharacterized protein n=1 Tax=Pseudoalteromonas holothuriae TaxID=2963714 RepID=A0ABN8UI82_9GAMM|nr:contractile injection system tape measure protein [Pseudoalteromonas sp. CIP111951]CAH9054022.1 hypothetical protein PSECIP111951_00942 [Pseudoalteromonas sp. CIP111951]